MSLVDMLIMSFHKTCLSCKYNRDTTIKASSTTWCLLRKIKLHSDLLGYASCHHWTEQEHSLQAIDVQRNIAEQQLDFARELVINDF